MTTRFTAGNKNQTKARSKKPRKRMRVLAMITIKDNAAGHLALKKL
jgi:hypothetical protein